jgi:hypothetical protein
MYGNLIQLSCRLFRFLTLLTTLRTISGHFYIKLYLTDLKKNRLKKPIGLAICTNILITDGSSMNKLFV